MSVTSHTALAAARIGPVGQRYMDLCADRDRANEQARELASLIDPKIMPPLAMTQAQPLTMPSSPMGKLGLHAMTGSAMSLAMPVDADSPWMGLEIPDAIERNPKFAREDVALAREALRQDARAIMEQLGTSPMRARHDAPFRRVLSDILRQGLVVGECVVEMRPKMVVTSHRRACYCVQRQEDTSLTEIVIRQEIDTRYLDDTKYVASQLHSDVRGKTQVAERTVPLFRHYTRDGNLGWRLVEEINGEQVYTRSDRVPMLWVPTWDIMPGQHYATGWFDDVRTLLEDLADLRTIRRELVQMEGDVVVIMDKRSGLRPAQVFPASGGVRGRVLPGGTVSGNGIAADVGVVTINKAQAISVIDGMERALKLEYGQMVGLDYVTAPKGDRVTREAVLRHSQVRDEITGGMFAPFLASVQEPLAVASFMQASRDGLLTKVPNGSPVKAILDDYTSVRVLTGAAALDRERRADRLGLALQRLQVVVPNVGEIMHMDAVAAELVGNVAGQMPGMVKTREEIRADRQRQINEQVQAQSALLAAQAAQQVAATQAAAQGG
jgi:hypothetical protein